MQTQLTQNQKDTFYRDGFVILKGAVEQKLVDAALDRIKGAKKGEYLGPDRTMTDLVNASSVTPILHEAMGQFDPPSTSQIGVLKRRQPGDYFNNLGYRDRDMPFFGAEIHVDGSCTIGVPQEPQEGLPADIYRRYLASGPKGDLGRSPDVIGHNSVPLFQDPEMTLGLGSFTAFVIVCLNDQSVEGRGQTALLKGAHHAVEKFFRYQRDVGNRIGVEGPGWPRLDHNVPNRCGLIYTPQSVLDAFVDSDAKVTPDGRKWPKPTQVLMEPGDVCITIYQIPHSGTRNQFGTESRKNIIFRIRNKSRQPNVVVSGVTDHPDRGQRGEWLEFEEGNNPWERSKFAMCNMWHEWEGMQGTVERMENHSVASDGMRA